ncbi:YGGT family protein [Thermosporothrix hazakensis]|jgi:uncharacterized protein YggT (Ycf19 family)|uniref:YGGT family protein n=2 Tax=Thermosporothrix TaxID=768650 RepID=A0A326TZR0_THEHA|nr:YggT family protein [Thermosporothrix hazakensis]PZW22982.1 YGGT family protein [Thermosporothrix hazakensis]BBH90073.1 hypothetical protein KTC_48240 [Thermosporothrix sp. COM3]GCE48294.1 hypothetical protein KTH_31630 [Thermosporothrix hazakensis]
MRNNPYEEPTGQADMQNRAGRMEDLPMRQPSLPPQQQPPPAGDPAPEIDLERQEEARTVKYAIGKLIDFLQWFTTVLEVALVLRFLLKLIGASSGNLFAGFLYSLTDIILFPFRSIVPSPSIRQDQAFEWSTLIAMLIYFLIFWAIRRFLQILISSPEEAPN